MVLRFSTTITLLFICMATLVLLTDNSGIAQEQQMKTKARDIQAADDNGLPPKIVFDREDLVYDLGTIAQGGQGKTVIKFKNTGKGVLKIESVKASCGCAAVLLSSDTIPPGGEARIESTLNVGRTKGPMKKVVTVNTNDPTNRSVRLTLQAMVDVEFGFEPSYVDFGRVSAKDVGKSLIATIIGKDIDKLSIKKIETMDPYIKAEYLPVGKESDGPRIKVTLIALPDQQGRFHSQVIVHSTREKTPLAALQVSGNISGPITISPERLLFRVAASNSETTQTVKIKNPEKKDFKILSIAVMEKPFPIHEQTGQNPVKSLEPTKDDLTFTIGLKDTDGAIPITFSFVRTLKEGERIIGKVVLTTNEPTQPEIELQYLAFFQLPHR